MKTIHYFMTLCCVSVLSTLLFIACEKGDGVPDETGDETPEKLIDIFDNFDVVDVETDDVVTINGLTPDQLDDYLTDKYGKQSEDYSPNDQLVELTTYLAINQLPYTNRKKYAQKYPDQPYGLAWVFNGKTDAQHDPSGKSDCQELLAGLDCSGLLYQGALKLGISIYPGKAVDQANPKNWTKWLSKTKYTHIVVETEEIMTWRNEDWKTGDIIVFDGGVHLGTIVNLSGGGIGIIHSQGSTTLTCEENSSSNKGPRVITSTRTTEWTRLTTKCSITRIRFVLKDSYNLSMKCIGRQYTAYTLNLSIDIDKSGNYQDEVVFKDYDGSINHQVISYTYDKKAGLLDFFIEMTDSDAYGVRTDIMTIPLSDLGELIPSEVSFTGGMYGCDAEFILLKGFAYSLDISLKSDQQQPDDGGCSVGY